MTTIVHDTTEAVCLCEEYNLYLKPIVKMTVSVALPQLKLPGKSISNWEVMERVKAMVAPEQFSALRISKSTMDFIRFEGEVENKGVVKSLLARLDGKTIKLSGFTDILKVRALENKMDFPTRHDWDSFFRDAKDMNETLPGERPDTIHLEGLPCRWFTRRDGQHPERPHEAVLRAVFQGFGPVRQVDIPMLDPYREEMLDKNFNTFTFGGHLNFDAYVQFQEYGGFTRAMDALRGMKLMLKGEDGKAVACNIKVAFDTNKHLSEGSIKKRQQERLKLQELERQREEQKRKEKEEEERRKEEEKKQKEMEEEEKERKKEERLRKREQKVREREEKRNLKKVKKRQEEDHKRLQMKIATEERRLLLAQRNLESIRLIAELLARAKVVKQQEAEQERAEQEAQERVEQARQQVELARLQRLEACRRRQEEELQRVETEKERALDLQRKERELRERLLGNLLKKTSGGAGHTPPRDEAALPGSDLAVRGVLAPVNGLKAEERQPARSSARSQPAEKRRTSGGREAQRREGRSGGREEENRRAVWQGGREGGQRSSEPGRRRRSSRSHSRERRRHSRSQKRSHSRRRSRDRRSDGRRSSQGRGHGHRRGSRSSSRDRSQSSSGRSHSGGRSRWHSRHRDDSRSHSGSHGDGRSRRRSRSGSRNRSRPRRH